MSRCFPFPPPGYEKRAIIDDTDLLTKVYIPCFLLTAVVSFSWVHSSLALAYMGFM